MGIVERCARCIVRHVVNGVKVERFENSVVAAHQNDFADASGALESLGLDDQLHRLADLFRNVVPGRLLVGTHG